MPSKNKSKESYSISSAIDCFPKNTEMTTILSERAKLIAAQYIDKIQRDEPDTYISFYLGETERYGIDYQYVKEVIDNINLTKLPCSIPCIAGVINKRGALLAILDLKQFLFNQTVSHDKFSIIIATAENITFGILVDRIIGNKNYNKNFLDSPFPSENIDTMEYILGLHEGKVAILNIRAVTTALVAKSSKNLISSGANL
jgi:chemotaxis signal transduction protein